MTEHYNPSRGEVRMHSSCPKCNAPAGMNCKRVNGMARKSNHIERVQKFRGLGSVGVESPQQITGRILGTRE